MSGHLERLKTALRQYALERELGHGAMATVYLARDRKHERAVAIKVLKPELAAVVGAERFLREIRHTARLTHPHILPVHDSGQADGLLYYVIPFVEGGSLRARLEREGQLPVEEALRIARQVADALAYAHAQGIVHRDIKPENVLLEEGHAVIADFGVARALEEAGGERLTGTGLAVGTPAYMSPEQAAGDRVDRRSDIYALGCVLYEMLTGRVPLTGPTLQSTLARRLTEDPPPIRHVREGVAPELEAVVDRALAKVAADRYESAADLRDALQASARQTPGHRARAAERRAPLEGGQRRSRGILLGLSVAAVLAITTGVFLALREPEPRLFENRVVVADFQNRTGVPALDPVGRMAADWIAQGVQHTGTIEVIPMPTALQASEFVRGQLEAGRIRDPVQALAEETGAGTVVHGAYYLGRDSLQFIMHATDARRGRLLASFGPETSPSQSPGEAIVRLQQRIMGFASALVDERRQLSPDLPSRPPTFEAYRAFSEGMRYYVRDKPREAIPLLYEAFARDSTFVVALLYAALNHSNLGELTEADSLLRLVARSKDRLSPYDRHFLEYRQARLAGDPDRALEAIREATKIAPASKAVYNLAVEAWERLRPREAIRALESLDPERGAMRGWFPYWLVLAGSYHVLGEHDRELAAARRARERYPDDVRGLLLELRPLAAMGRTREVDRLLSTVEALSPRTESPPGFLLRRTGEELLAHGHVEPGRKVLGRAIAWFENAPSVATSSEAYRREHALLLYRAERLQEAQELFEGLAVDFPERLEYRAHLGMHAARRGDRKGAMDVSAWLQELDRKYLFGLNTLYQAAIASLLGERDRAVSLLRKALSEGMTPLWIHETGAESDFSSLQSHPGYRPLMEPKG